MQRNHHSRHWLSFLAGFWLSITPAVAQDSFDLQILANPSQTEPQVLPLELLDTFAQIEFTTSTIWTDGLSTFRGVPLKALLDASQAQGTTVEMVALNDYAVAIPISELETNAPIVATRINGEQMSVRDKGPFWVVYPYDSAAKYRTETTYSRSIWQLNRLRVVD